MLSMLLRRNLTGLLQTLATIQPPGRYINLEGGGIEQQHDRRLQLHHCANYAAALTILRQEQRQLRLLELGCGTGVLSYCFAQLMPPGWSLLATDYSRDLIEYARLQYATSNLEFARLDVNDLTGVGLDSFDAVLMLELIEHLSPGAAGALLFRLHERLRAGSLVIISTPDRSPFRRDHSGYHPHRVEYRYSTLLRFLSGRQNNPFSDFRIYQLVSAGLVRAAVRAEEYGGYYINRIAGLIERLTAGRNGLRRFQRGIFSLASRFFRLVSGCGKDRLVSRIIDEIELTGIDTGEHRPSFSLVAVLRK